MTENWGRNCEEKILIEFHKVPELEYTQSRGLFTLYGPRIVVYSVEGAKLRMSPCATWSMEVKCCKRDSSHITL